jgi:hypothetical protein
MNTSDSHSDGASQAPASRTPLSRLITRPLGLMAGAALVFLAIGATAGIGGSRLVDRWRPQPVMLLQVMPVNKLEENSPVAVKGRVTEIFGNKFIIDDGNGHALIDLGPRGEDAKAVTKDEIVTVQGRFDRGVLHAQVLVHSDGRTEAFGPPPPPDRGPPGPRDRNADPPPPPPPPGRDVPPPPPPLAGPGAPLSPPPGQDVPPPPPPPPPPAQ